MDDLNVDKLKTVPVDLKKSNDVVDKEFVKNTNFSTLKTKVNNLEKNALCNYFNLDQLTQHR